MDIEEFFVAQKTKTSITAGRQRAATGFPSPAEDFAGQSLSLDEHLVRHPSATYFCRVTGNAMIAAGIHDGDLLVVDSALTPTDKSVVVALMFGELVVRRLHKTSTAAWLLAETQEPGFPPIEITKLESTDLFWGVVTWVLHQP